MKGDATRGSPLEAPDPDVGTQRLSDAMLADLYRKAGAERFGLSQEGFSQILEEVSTKYLPAGAGQAEV